MINRAKLVTLVLLLAAMRAEAQVGSSYRLTVVPEQPTTQDTIHLMVSGYMHECPHAYFLPPQVTGNVITVGVTYPLFPCNPSLEGPWSGQIDVAPQPAGIYKVEIGDLASSTIRVVEADPLPPLILLNRFSAQAVWGGQDPVGPGHSVLLSEEAGQFWFFDAANPEVTVKVLDGRGVHGHFWVFLGSLTNVGYRVTVTDTGASICQGLGAPACPVRTYVSPPGDNAGIIDVAAF